MDYHPPIHLPTNNHAHDIPQHPPLPQSIETSPLMFHVYKKWFHNEILILDADNTTTLYTSKSHWLTPGKSTINSTSTQATIGKVNIPYLSLTNRIKTTVHDTPIELKRRGLFTRGYTWSSPALGNMKLIWRTRFFYDDFECLDEQGATVARFEYAGWSWSFRKVGTFVFYSEMASGGVMEEILVTGLAMVVQHKSGLKKSRGLDASKRSLA